jgi:hypothetical protein
MAQDQPQAMKYHCPECKAENFPLAVLNTPQPLRYVVGKQTGEIATLRSITCCSACGCVLSIQFLPFDIQVWPEPPGIIA